MIKIHVNENSLVKYSFDVYLDEEDTLDNIAQKLNIKCYVAKVNNRLRELTYHLKSSSTVEFLGLDDFESVRVYQLRYLIVYALKEIDPNANILFSHFISRSFYGEISNNNHKFNESYLNKLKDKLNEIINKNIPIVRRNVSKNEANKIYQEEHYLDKCQVLAYRTEDMVHLYQCSDYQNYMYGYMLPSTGYIKDYDLKMYYPGFVIQYPRSEFKGKVPSFQDDPTFSQMIFSARKWSKQCGVENIASMNEFTLDRDFVDFVHMCETKHNNMLAEIGNQIKNNSNIRLVAIAGPSSSGKTTFSNRLRIELMTMGLKPIMISMDDYYLNRENTPLDENGNPDFENINALDINLFNEQLMELIAGDIVTLPSFDFKVGKRMVGKTIQLEQNQPIIIEGIHALNETLTKLIPANQKYKIYISPVPQINIDDHNPIIATDLRLLRRIVRDAMFRKTSPENTFRMWENVRKGEFKWIYPWQASSNYVFNSSLAYEIMVMKKYALPALQSIDCNNEFFIQANRLIKFLKYFKDIDDKYVPCNSILREFIGGSCFYE